jgi:catechol 2,3-dioxygenase-like lactoylglutathione lyase family enzyme
VRKYIHGITLFAAGMMAGHFFLSPDRAQAQDDRLTGIRINHIGIYAKDWDETINFYTRTLGFKEAFTLKDEKGNVRISFIQMNNENFLEIARATPEHPPGLYHIGFGVDDMQGTVAALRKKGIKVADARIGNSHAPITGFTDPNGIHLELMEFGPESLQRKAMDAWK